MSRRPLRRPDSAPSARGRLPTGGPPEPWLPPEGCPGEPPAAQAWIRQTVACALVFFLSARIPGHLAALLALFARPLPTAADPLMAAALMVLLDAFGVLCALYFTHSPLRGLRLWRCYPPQRLIPLSLHVLGLLWGLLSLTLDRGGAGG